MSLIHSNVYDGMFFFLEKWISIRVGRQTKKKWKKTESNEKSKRKLKCMPAWSGDTTFFCDGEDGDELLCLIIIQIRQMWNISNGPHYSIRTMKEIDSISMKDQHIYISS